MTVIQETITKYKCDKCGHIWTPRQNTPTLKCPVCQSMKWNETKAITGEKSSE
jgi:rubrerythrin